MSSDEGQRQSATLSEKVIVLVNGSRDRPEFLREYMWRLVDMMKDIQKSIRRDFALMIILAFVFELINRRLVGEASAMGIKLAKLNFLLYAIPVAVAWLVMRADFSAREREVCARTHDELTKLAFRGYWESSLDALVISSSAPAGRQFPHGVMTPRSNVILRTISNVQSTVIVLVFPVGFSLYAIVQMFRTSNHPYIAAWISAILTVTLLGASYVTRIFVDMKDN